MEITQQSLGWIAFTTTVLAFLFQAQKTIVSKDVASLSLSTFIVNFIGNMLWTSYGLFLGSIQACLANVLVALCISIVFYYSLKERTTQAIVIGVSSALALVSIGLLSMTAINSLSGTFVLDNASIEMAIGIMAGVFTSCSFVPQVIKIIRAKEAESIALFLVATYAFSQLCWLGYWGINIGIDSSVSSWLPGMFWSTLTSALQTILTWLKIIDIFAKKRKAI